MKKEEKFITRERERVYVCEREREERVTVSESVDEKETWIEYVGETERQSSNWIETE